MSKQLISHRALRERLGGVSAMHIWRLQNDPRYADLDFPSPIRLRQRLYWVAGEIDDWIDAQRQHSGEAA